MGADRAREDERMAGDREGWGGLFSELTLFCPRCGWAPVAGDCPLCNHPTAVGPGSRTRFLGRWVNARRGLRSWRGIAVERSGDGHGEVVRVLATDGHTVEARRDKVWLV